MQELKKKQSLASKSQVDTTFYTAEKSTDK